jgi:hypothetical protein
MNEVGECVGFEHVAQSPPRGARPALITLIDERTAFSASYVVASSWRYDGAAASVPSALNCGIQNRFELGSLPTMTSLTLGSDRAIEAAYCANCACASALVGAVADPKGVTTTIGLIPASPAAVTAFPSTSNSESLGAACPGDQIDVMRIESKPAARARSILALATDRSGWRAPSSSAPTSIDGPPANADGTNTSATRTAARPLTLIPTPSPELERRAA